MIFIFLQAAFGGEMSRISHVVALFALIMAFGVGVDAQSPITPGKAPEVTGKAAEVNGVPILTADVDDKISGELAKLQEQVYALRKKQLDSMIDQKLIEVEAAKRGVTIAALVESEITSRVSPVTAEEVNKFFEDNKARLQGDLKTLEPQIKNFLAAQRLQSRQLDFIRSLRTAAKVDVFLAAPPIVRMQVATTGAPVRGAVNAPVTIVEFSDFHCPFCRKVQPVLEQLRTNYKEKIKIVYRDFPLDSLHPQARAAAEAAGCANEQGKFWEFHDKVFDNNPDGSDATLGRFAKEIGLDTTAFDTCRTAGKYKTSVLASNQEGTKLGITGTPTFFINGRMLVGSQPYEAFVRVIDEELALAASAPASASR
jgi:protein-disulfide isomerase